MAREVIIELFDALNEALEARGCDFSDVWTDREAAREIPSTMPSTDVAVTLKTAAHRNPQRAGFATTSTTSTPSALRSLTATSS
jgi:hypothetical protein